MWTEALIVMTALQNGERLEWKEPLRQGKTFVLIEKDCAGCEIYFRSLKNCRIGIREKLVLVSISPGKATKEMARRLPSGPQIFLAEKEQFQGLAAATPTSFQLSKSGNLLKFVGPRSCEDLENLQKQSL